nr:transposase family protein [Burkholderia ambifaria]
MLANILNLSAYEVLSVEHGDHDYHVSAEVKQLPTHCPTCNADRLVGFGRREQLVRDLPMHGRRVGMYISTRRMQCRDARRGVTGSGREAVDDRAARGLDRQTGDHRQSCGASRHQRKHGALGLS